MVPVAVVPVAFVVIIVVVMGLVAFAPSSSAAPSFACLARGGGGGRGGGCVESSEWGHALGESLQLPPMQRRGAQQAPRLTRPLPLSDWFDASDGSVGSFVEMRDGDVS